MVTGSRPSDVAVCTLTDRWLAARFAGTPRVAVAAALATANLGIVRVILGMLERPAARHLVVCGRDSPLFRQGQSLIALAEHGCRPDGTIIGAKGHLPRLVGLRPGVVAEFRRRVTVWDHVGHNDPERLAAAVRSLPVRPTVPVGPDLAAEIAECGVPLRHLPAGGRRSPAGAGEGCFVVSVGGEDGRIVLRHYTDDLRAGHELRSHSAEALLHAAVRHGLVHDPAHAGYLGAELAKAEAAVRLGLCYVQDRPLATREGAGAARARSDRATPVTVRC